VNVRTEAEELERLRERARLNEASALAHAERRRSLEIAKNLKDDGFDVDAIARSTGLTVDEVLKL